MPELSSSIRGTPLGALSKHTSSIRSALICGSAWRVLGAAPPKVFQVFVVPVGLLNRKRVPEQAMLKLSSLRMTELLAEIGGGILWV